MPIPLLVFFLRIIKVANDKVIYRTTKYSCLCFSEIQNKNLKTSIGVEHGNDEFHRKVLNRFCDDNIIIKAFEIVRQSGIRVCAIPLKI